MEDDFDWDRKGSPEVWAIKITATWQKATVSIVNTGLLLADAKRQLKHGQWHKMFGGRNGLPFSADTARCLMKIAGHPVISKPENSRYLPASWYGLYELSQIPGEQLEVMIASRIVHAELKGKDIDDIIKKHNAGTLDLYIKLWASLETLVNFRTRWPDPHQIPAAFAKEGKAGVAASLALLPDWLTELDIARRGALEKIDVNDEYIEHLAAEEAPEVDDENSEQFKQSHKAAREVMHRERLERASGEQEAEKAEATPL